MTFNILDKCNFFSYIFFGVHMLARHQPNRLFNILLFLVLIINMPMLYKTGYSNWNYVHSIYWFHASKIELVYHFSDSS